MKLCDYVPDLVSREDLLRSNGKANSFPSTVMSLRFKIREQITEMFPLFCEQWCFSFELIILI